MQLIRLEKLTIYTRSLENVRIQHVLTTGLVNNLIKFTANVPNFIMASTVKKPNISMLQSNNISTKHILI